MTSWPGVSPRWARSPKGWPTAKTGLRIAEAVDHPHSLSQACHGIGYVYLHKGELHQAIAWLERGLEVCRVWDIPLLLYLVSSTLGYAYVLAGRVSDALPLLEQSVSTEGMGIMRGRVHVWLSEAYLRLGRLDEALAVAVRGLELCRTHAQQGEQAWALRLLGEIHAHRQPPEAELAEAAYREALALAEALGMRPLQAHCHRGLGTLYATTGQREQARAELSTAIEMYRDDGDDLLAASDGGGTGAGGRVMTVGERRQAASCNTSPKTVTRAITTAFHPVLLSARSLLPML